VGCQSELVLLHIRRAFALGFGHPNPASPLVMYSLWLRGSSLRSPHHHLPWFVRVYKPHRGPHIDLIMSRDVSNLSDISRMTTESDGAFKRAASSFRNFIKARSEFPPERGTWYYLRSPPLLLTRIRFFANADRYHLYVSYACRESARYVRFRSRGCDGVSLCFSMGLSHSHHAQVERSRGHHP